MTEAPGGKVRCDICGKIISDKHFKHIMVFKATYEEVYYHESCTSCEKCIDACNSCGENLNFREIEQ